jgi:hypothetical protein
LAHELLLTNESTDPVRVEFLYSAPGLAWYTDPAGVASYGQTFPMAPWATLHCLLEPGRYHIRIHRRLLETAEGSLWEAHVETIDVR